MEPAATGPRQLNIVPQVSVHLAQLIVLLRLVNSGTSMEMFWMVFIEAVLTVQVRK